MPTFPMPTFPIPNDGRCYNARDLTSGFATTNRPYRQPRCLDSPQRTADGGHTAQVGKPFLCRCPPQCPMPNSQCPRSQLPITNYQLPITFFPITPKYF
ncbi:MAG: hypothetical protein KME31_09455 [Tolypothrix carrinoi HA7290-LM1]|nr:hypothetical protein [Tolypothrix carrinoi HA7290-LM1]